MLDDLELNFLDNFEKRSWRKDLHNFWLEIDDEKTFVSSMKILKDKIGFSFLIDQYANQDGENIVIYYDLYHPIKKQRLVVTYKINKKYVMYSIQSIWEICDWKENEIFELFGIRTIKKIEQRLLTQHKTDGFPAISKELEKYLLGDSLIFHSQKESRCRLLPFEGTESILDFKIVEKNNRPSGVLTKSKNNIYQAAINLGGIHKGIEYQINGLKLNEIEKLLETIDPYSFFQNKFNFFLLLEKYKLIKVGEDELITRTLLLELERMYRHITIIRNMLIIKNLSLDFEPIFSKIQLLYNDSQRIFDDHSVFENHNLIQEILSFLNLFLEFTSKNKFKKLMKSFKNISIINSDLALNLCFSGPVLRSSGFLFDWREIEKYLIFDKLKLKKNIQTSGDLKDRYQVYIDELISSAKIILQLSEIKLNNLTVNRFFDKNFDFKKDGQYCNLIEGNNGILSHSFIIKDKKILRYRICTPDFSLIKLYEKIIVNEHPDHAELIWNSLGINLGMAER